MRTPDEVREYLRHEADNYALGSIEKSKVGATIGRLKEQFGSNEGRRKFLAWVFCDDGSPELHRKDMLNRQWIAIYNWVGFYEEDGVWNVSPRFISECQTILDHLKRLGKM